MIYGIGAHLVLKATQSLGTGIYKLATRLRCSIKYFCRHPTNLVVIVVAARTPYSRFLDLDQTTKWEIHSSRHRWNLPPSTTLPLSRSQIDSRDFLISGLRLRHGNWSFNCVGLWWGRSLFMREHSTVIRTHMCTVASGLWGGWSYRYQSRYVNTTNVTANVTETQISQRHETFNTAFTTHHQRLTYIWCILYYTASCCISDSHKFPHLALCLCPECIQVLHLYRSNRRTESVTFVRRRDVTQAEKKRYSNLKSCR